MTVVYINDAYENGGSSATNGKKRDVRRNSALVRDRRFPFRVDNDPLTSTANLYDYTLNKPFRGQDLANLINWIKPKLISHANRKQIILNKVLDFNGSNSG